MRRRTKNFNIKQLYRTVYEKGSATKPELGQELGLSLTAVSDYVNQLEELGYILSTDKGSSTGGRKPWLYEINPDFRFIVGVDMRASHFYIFLSDLRGRLLYSEFVSVHKTYELYLERIAQAIEALLAKKGINRSCVMAVGVSISGVTDFDNKVVDLSNELNGRAVLTSLEDILGVLFRRKRCPAMPAMRLTPPKEQRGHSAILELSGSLCWRSALQGYTNSKYTAKFLGKTSTKSTTIRTCALFQEISDLPYYCEGTEPYILPSLTGGYRHSGTEPATGRSGVSCTEVARMMIVMVNVVTPSGSSSQATSLTT